MTDSSQLSKAQDLQCAFDVFNQVSYELTVAHAGLQVCVQSLTDEFAVANGEAVSTSRRKRCPNAWSAARRIAGRCRCRRGRCRRQCGQSRRVCDAW